MKVKTGWLETYYELSGEGPCVVLIHGLGDNLTMWYNQVPVFAEWFQVLAYDVRGHGKTETSEKDFSMKRFANDLNDLLKALGIEKACIVGYSMGGRIGLQFALEYPSMATGLVMVNSLIMSPDIPLTPEQTAAIKEQWKQIMALMRTGEIATIADTMTERAFSPGFRDKQPVVFQRYKEVKMGNNPASYPRIIQGSPEDIANPPDLKKLKCQTLIIAGENDDMTSVDIAQSMTRAINLATIKILPTGHASALEAPEAFNQAVLDFMKNL